MRRDVYIFRHGQTEKNVQGVWQGSGIDAILNAKGEKQVLELARKSLTFGLTKIYCSPLLRAVQTANAIARFNSNMPIVVLQDLRECYFGECEGMTFEESRAKFGDEFVDSLFAPTWDNWDTRFPKAESKHEVFLRVERCLRNILLSLPKDENHCVGIVCHAGVMSALECGLALKSVSYDNCSVLHLSYDMDTQKWVQIFD